MSPPSTADGAGTHVVGELIRAARPQQWIKNALVFAAPAAAGVVHLPHVAGRVSVTFVAFCLAASSAYLLNDAADATWDRQHPDKRSRPVAAGRLSPRTSRGVAAVLVALSVAVAATLGSAAVIATITAYMVLTAAYSSWLKHIAVVDIVVVAAGYPLRAAAGGFAAGVVLSEWFLIVTSFGALFLVAGKRHAELAAYGSNRDLRRPALATYPPLFTQHLLTTTSAITLLAYCLWAFGAQTDGIGAPWLAVSIVPFTFAFLRYAQLVFDGEGHDPTELMSRDLGLLATGGVWALALLAGIYGVGDVG